MEKQYDAEGKKMRIKSREGKTKKHKNKRRELSNSVSDESWSGRQVSKGTIQYSAPFRLTSPLDQDLPLKCFFNSQ
jgi:hypothetical protein